jgi:hypothetical protein
LCKRHGAYSENNQGGGNRSNVATATTNNNISNFPRGGGQKGMPMNHNFGAANSGFCQPTTQSGFLQHSNATPGNQQIEPAEIGDNEATKRKEAASSPVNHNNNESGPPKKKSKKYFCSVAGCSKWKIKGGVCVSHGAKVEYKRCSVEECSTFARRKNGLCEHHFNRSCSDPNQRCQFQYPTHRCGIIATYGGFCVSHRFGSTRNPQQIEPAAEISDNEDEGDTQLNSKAQSNFGGEGRKGLKRQHSLPLPTAKNKDSALASSKEDGVPGDEKSQLRGFMAETDQIDEEDEPVASHRGVGPLKELDVITGGHNQDDGSKKEGDKLNEDIEWGGDDQDEYFPVDGEVDDKSDCEKQSDVVPEEVAVDTENNEKEEMQMQRLNAELTKKRKQVIALEEKLEEAARYKSSSESERNDLRAQLRTKEIELNEKSATIAALKQKFSELNAEKEDKLQTAAMKEAALQYQVEANSGVIKDLKETLEELTAELEEVMAEKESLQSQLFKTKFAQLLGISKKEAAIAKLEGKVKDFEETFWKQKEEWKKLHAKLGEKSSSAEELKKSNKFLETHWSSH